LIRSSLAFFMSWGGLAEGSPEYTPVEEAFEILKLDAHKKQPPQNHRTSEEANPPKN